MIENYFYVMYDGKNDFPLVTIGKNSLDIQYSFPQVVLSTEYEFMNGDEYVFMDGTDFDFN